MGVGGCVTSYFFIGNFFFGGGKRDILSAPIEFRTLLLKLSISYIFQLKEDQGVPWTLSLTCSFTWMSKGIKSENLLIFVLMSKKNLKIRALIFLN